MKDYFSKTFIEEMCLSSLSGTGDVQPVVSQMDMRRQLLLYLRVQSDTVAHVDQVRLLRFYPPDIRKSLLQRFVRRVRTPAKGGQDQYIQAFQLGILLDRKSVV